MQLGNFWVTINRLKALACSVVRETPNSSAAAKVSPKVKLLRSKFCMGQERKRINVAVVKGGGVPTNFGNGGDGRF